MKLFSAQEILQQRSSQEAETSFPQHLAILSLLLKGQPDAAAECLRCKADQTHGFISFIERHNLKLLVFSLLDEIEAMEPFVQSELMRVLKDCNTVHLGGQQTLDSDVRVIAATDVPLQDLVARGKTRSDLYYRINVLPIHLLPLRERTDDIPLLIDDFLRRHPLAIQKGIVGVSRETIARLIQYLWPGNIRELQNVLEKDDCTH